MNMYQRNTLAILGLLLATTSWMAVAEDDTQPAKRVAASTDAEGQALERTRKQVRMLDDIYKGGIVLITTHYVNEDSDLPAGTAFKKLFEAAKAKGWHEVRLLDATGSPYNDENAPESKFEKKAIKTLKSGKGWYEEVEEAKGKKFLRVATPIPVVMEKCVMCHDNYAEVKKGQPIGALGYRIPIE